VSSCGRPPIESSRGTRSPVAVAALEAPYLPKLDRELIQLHNGDRYLGSARNRSCSWPGCGVPGMSWSARAVTWFRRQRGWSAGRPGELAG
jgi:hypothetical protein